MQAHQLDEFHFLLQFRFRHGLEFPDSVIHPLGGYLPRGKIHFPRADKLFNHAVFPPDGIQPFPDDRLAALGNGQFAPCLVQGTEKIQFSLAEGPEVGLLVLFRHLFFQGGEAGYGNGEAQAAGHVDRIFLEDLFNIPGKEGSFHQPDCLATSLLEASFSRALFRSGFMTRPIWRAWF